MMIQRERDVCPRAHPLSSAGIEAHQRVTIFSLNYRHARKTANFGDQFAKYFLQARGIDDDCIALIASEMTGSSGAPPSFLKSGNFSDELHYMASTRELSIRDRLLEKLKRRKSPLKKMFGFSWIHDARLVAIFLTEMTIRTER